MIGRLIPLILFISACGSTDTDIIQAGDEDRDLPKPWRILVYDFAVSPAEVAETGHSIAAIDDPNTNPKREALERQIADALATELVEELHDLGLPAERWRGLAPTGLNIYTMEGQFLTIDEGNALGRMIVGFGVGGTELRTRVQFYEIEGGQKKLLGEVEVSNESSRKPGIAAMLPVGAAISGIETAAAVSTGVGVVTELNQELKNGAEDTAEAIIDLIKPRMEDLDWI